MQTLGQVVDSFTKVKLKNFPLQKLIRNIKHIVTVRKTRAKFYLTNNGQDKSVLKAECFNFFMMGMTWFRQGEIVEKATQ
jgi:hypothetical protein